MTGRPVAVYRALVRANLARLRKFRVDPLRLDLLLAAALLAGAELQVSFGGIATHHRVSSAVVAAAVTAAVAVRRRYPTTVGVVAPVLTAVEVGVWGDPQLICAGIASFCALYGLSVWTDTRRFTLGTATVVLASLAAAAGPHSTLSDSVFFTLVMLAVMLLVRRVVGDRERRVELAERERDVAAREAVVEERARIARELHDAIAHNVSMIVVQAGAERRVLDGAYGSTREVLQTIEQIGRGALTEMRRLVGMLRSDAPDSLAPQPGLADLPTLVMQVREAGLPVELHVQGEPRTLPVGIELSAYRIVQEALTNALKHAGNAHAAVNVRYDVDSLELEIVDDGVGALAPVSGGGHGMVGMRERVALYGGRLDAGRAQGGGFAVRVVLPIR
jgi:signal transduction histidine kinase